LTIASPYQVLEYDALLYTLLDAGPIDDVYLTTGLNTGGEPGTPLCSVSWRGRTVVRKGGTARPPARSAAVFP